jgi:hypothetical protein
MPRSDAPEANRFPRKPLLAAVLGLSVVALVLLAASLRHLVAAGSDSPASATAPDNPLRTAGTGDLPAPSKTSPDSPNGSAGKLAASSTENSSTKRGEAAATVNVPPGKHPLDPALAEAGHIAAYLRKNVKDYTCVIVKQERIGGTLNPPEYMAAKIRQQPFSVYLKFLRPDSEKGREVMYVAGANDGNLVAREGSGLKRALGFVLLKPNGPVAMLDNRYPITEIGISNLIDRLIEVGQQDRKYAESEVHFYKNAKVNGRVCTLIEVIHPTLRTNFRFHKAQIYIDDELHVPIRYASYQWPKQPGGDPPLDEAYTYLDLKLNVGLTDADFDYRSPQYHFVGK